MPELLLDPNIRVWVFLPIVIITFFLGVLRYYVLNLLSSTMVNPKQFYNSQAMIRSRLLRKSAGFIPKESFLMRRYYFNNQDTGYFVIQERDVVPRNPMTDPNAMIDTLKDNIMNILSTVIIGGWINEIFSGFVTTKVPFPLTLRFKPMLQKDIALESLDPAWVSSASWFFLNIFGLPPIYTMLFGEISEHVGLFPQVYGHAFTAPRDAKAAFKAEREALQIFDYLSNVKNINIFQ